MSLKQRPVPNRDEDIAKELIDGSIEQGDPRIDLGSLSADHRADLERRLKQRQRSIFNTDGTCGPG